MSEHKMIVMSERRFIAICCTMVGIVILAFALDRPMYALALPVAAIFVVCLLTSDDMPPIWRPAFSRKYLISTIGCLLLVGGVAWALIAIDMQDHWKRERLPYLMYGPDPPSWMFGETLKWEERERFSWWTALTGVVIAVLWWGTLYLWWRVTGKG